MKTLRFALVAFGAGIASVTAAPRLFVSTPTLAPESGIELILDRAVVPDEAVGRPADNDWLDVTPALPGKLEWKAPNVARFLPDKAPALGTTYQFSLRSGHKHLDQSPVPAGKIATVQSSPFQIEAAVPVDRYSSTYSPRTAVWFLRFNDEIDPTAAAPFFSFESKTGQRVAAKTQRATYGAVSKVGYDGESWTQRFDKARSGKTGPVEHSEDEPFSLGLLVTPLTPLPVGQDWKLAVLAGLPNTAANAKLTENTVRWVGNIEPFRISSISANTIANQPRRVVVDFNLALPKPLPPEWLDQAIAFDPKPADLKATVEGSQLTLEGDFSTQDDWELVLREPFASADGRTLAEHVTKSLKFERLEPSLALPTDEEAQLAAGSRRYRIETVNLKDVNVRVKTMAGVDLVRAFQGYRHYTGRGPNETELKPTGPVPFELIAGAHTLEQTFQLDTKIDQSKEIVLEWDRLIPGAPKHGAFFLEATGSALEGSKTEVDGQTRTKPSAQAFVQLTDIGLAWKLAPKSALVYAFSCTTGEPLRGVKLDVFGEDAKPLQSSSTGADGLASLPRSEVARHLRASLGDDTFITAFDTGMTTVSLWRFPVRYAWETPAETNRRVMVFTDRSLYRPGETIHLKGLIRTQRGNAIEAADAAKPHVRVLDPTEQEVLNREITLSTAGSFDLDFTAPEEEVGTYQIQVEWPEEVAKAEALDDDHYEDKERILGNARFEFTVRVDEFRRNAFELTQTMPEPLAGATALQVDLTARYYQGQAVSEGKARHYSRVEEVNLYPDRFRDFLFGNHKVDDWHYWFHYFNYKWDDQPERQTTAANGELKLDATGKTSFAVSLPQGDFPTAREVSVSTEVTDANNQTLTTESKTTVHPASVYVGVSRLDRLVRAGDRVPLKLVAVTPSGEPFDQPVTVETTLIREINEQSKTRTESGATVTRNDLREETISTGTTTLDPAANRGEGTEFVFSPTQTGKHFLTLKGKDAAGHSFATTTTYYVYGSDEYPWAYEEGMKIKLVPEKKAYKPGETARVLVLSPIEGSALVTVERESVLRSFTVPLKADKPVIEIPLTDDDAPNAYVSVLVIKGAQDSARKFKEPQLRLGYCELSVENRRDRLAVTLTAENSTDTMTVSTNGSGTTLPAYRPGEEVIVSGKVTRADGSPAAGAEVTLYAEDEGTLAVMGYENPDPVGFFYNPRLLTVLSGTSLENFVSEDPEQQSFFNKGFFVGGGDEAADFGNKLRKDFNPCATWAPTLIAGPDGKFRHSFKLPDTLTRYRVLAIVSEGVTRFGNTQADIVVNKPVMLEPKAPRFANESDTLTPQVLVQNASPHSGTWKITFSPHAATGPPVCRALDETTRTVTLAAGASTTVPFPIMIETTGEAVLTFRAEPVSLENSALTPVLAKKLSDSVEARFPVNYPMPLLRQTKLVKLDAGGGKADLNQLLDPKLLEGKGTLDLEFSRSLLLEAAGSIDYLLSYPHGCVEQTTSSLMPWLAVESLKPYVPRFASLPDKKVETAIQKGADRLLSMQLPAGGFTYWPGNRERVDWATSYAGLGLVLAREAGANVPDSAVEGLCNDLISSLRGISDLRSPWDMESATRGLWVLSLAGKPQPSYHNLLRDRLEQLSPRSRCFLALAIAEGDGDNAKAEAAAILRSSKPFRAKDDSWMTYNPDDALTLLAWSRIDPTSPESTRSIDRMLRDRNPYGEWRTTWVNGWSLLALANYAEGEADRDDVIAIQVNGENIALDSEHSSASRKFELGAGTLPAIQSDAVAFLRANLAAKPKIAPQQPVGRNGLEVTRFYERVKPDGSIEPLDRPAVGDLIRVTLRVTLPHDDTRYVVVDDPLPAIFETVNSDFTSQRAASGASTSENNWTVSHSELRSDRAVFFVDRVWRGGTYHVTYLARCTVPGEAIAPVAKVESMYDPENFALSASRVFKTR